MEDPAERPGAQIKGLDVAGRRGMRLGLAAADDDHVFVNDAGRGERDRECAEVRLHAIDGQTLAQIDVTIFAEAGDQIAGVGVEAVEKVHHAGVDAAALAIIPVRDAASRLAGDDAGVEFPLQLTGSGIESDDLGLRRVGVERAADDERVGLDRALLAGVVGPCLLKQVHIVAIDLREPGVVIAVQAAVVDGPVRASLRETKWCERERQQ